MCNIATKVGSAVLSTFHSTDQGTLTNAVRTPFRKICLGNNQSLRGYTIQDNVKMFLLRNERLDSEFLVIVARAATFAKQKILAGDVHLAY